MKKLLFYIFFLSVTSSAFSSMFGSAGFVPERGAHCYHCPDKTKFWLVEIAMNGVKTSFYGAAQGALYVMTQERPFSSLEDEIHFNAVVLNSLFFMTGVLVEGLAFNFQICRWHDSLRYFMDDHCIRTIRAGSRILVDAAFLASLTAGGYAVLSQSLFNPCLEETGDFTKCNYLAEVAVGQTSVHFVSVLLGSVSRFGIYCLIDKNFKEIEKACCVNLPKACIRSSKSCSGRIKRMFSRLKSCFCRSRRREEAPSDREEALLDVVSEGKEEEKVDV